MAYSAVGANDVDPVLERTILLKQESCIYKIPANQIGDDQKGWKANGWTLDKPDWTGKLRLTSKGTQCVLKLEEKASSGKEFAHVEVDTYPGPAVQTVTDSSRYFVIKTDTFGHVGLGFADRTDAFDLNVALQDHFKSLRLEEQIQKESEAPVEKLDLSLKEGQTIKVNINIPGRGTPKRDRSKSPAVKMPAPTPEMVAAGIVPPPPKEPQAVAPPPLPRINKPPVRQANPNWIQF